jgi:hypothetical protein
MMMIETKFGVGDTVYKINNERKQRRRACTACDGLGRISLPDGDKYNCPACGGRGVFIDWEPTKWLVAARMTVGQVRIHVSFEDKDDEERYMTHETGVGSGTLHNALDLFATKEEAQAECDKRNTEKGE